MIVIAAALVALVAHGGAGDVRWRAGTAFGLAAGVSALAGSVLNRALNPDVLLLAFTPVMIVGAVAMVSDAGPATGEFRPWRFGVGLDSVARVIDLGLLVGWMIGLFGVGGGFVIVPVLVLGLRFSMIEAVGTSLLVICIGSGFALVDRIVSGDVDWAIAIPFSIAAGLGALVGRRLAERLGGERLRQVFAGVIVPSPSTRRSARSPRSPAPEATPRPASPAGRALGAFR